MFAMPFHLNLWQLLNSFFMKKSKLSDRTCTHDGWALTIPSHCLLFFPRSFLSNRIEKEPWSLNKTDQSICPNPVRELIKWLESIKEMQKVEHITKLLLGLCLNKSQLQFFRLNLVVIYISKFSSVTVNIISIFKDHNCLDNQKQIRTKRKYVLKGLLKTKLGSYFLFI